mgnify:CR=1 FL=1
MEAQLEAAIKEIKKLNDKYDSLYRDFSLMKLYAKDLEKEIAKLKAPNKNKKIDHILSEAEYAMKRYTDKLRKESETYAKQK